MADDKNRMGKVMNEQEKFEKRKKITKYVLIIISVLFVFFMLVMPLFCIVSSSLKQGLGFYFKSVSSKYVVSALKVTLFATVIAVVINTFFGLCAAWVTTKFSFKNDCVITSFDYNMLKRVKELTDDIQVGYILSIRSEEHTSELQSR